VLAPDLPPPLRVHPRCAGNLRNRDVTESDRVIFGGAEVTGNSPQRTLPKGQVIAVTLELLRLAYSFLAHHIAPWEQYVEVRSGIVMGGRGGWVSHLSDFNREAQTQKIKGRRLTQPPLHLEPLGRPS